MDSDKWYDERATDSVHRVLVGAFHNRSEQHLNGLALSRRVSRDLQRPGYAIVGARIALRRGLIKAWNRDTKGSPDPADWVTIYATPEDLTRISDWHFSAVVTTLS